ncbi:hypothetical protein K2173_005753 [Erythroxylum novogranatense]|uniref:Uncharacterized protein n=1 Tax=Erythroxylum novogranatense TaxID=1862640 RepID=A0AAV8U2J4_9ROSI|nr:hypothetical protein K2173_005753 [Erythroxylum novogranatense]
MATNSRESRRKRILDRSGDRLAFITGRIQSLPSQSHLPDTSPQPSNSQAPVSFLSCQTSVKDEASVLPDHGPTIYPGNAGSIVEPELNELATRILTSSSPTPDAADNEHSSLTSMVHQKLVTSASSSEQHVQPMTHKDIFVSASQVSSAITATWRSRLVSTVAIALSVIFSHSGFPVLGSNLIKSIISFRPLYLVLLTNLTLVLAHLLSDRQRSIVRGEDRTPSTEKYEWTDQAGKALEVVLVIRKAMDAIFIDCSVYGIITICGLSVLSTLS